MAGNAYPHIIFAKSSDVLPQQALADLLAPMFPEGEVEQGEIKAELKLPDWTFTFWYDDDAEGLGERYAEFAAPLRRRRVTRCTTMIDASGDADPDGKHASDIARIMGMLAEQHGVYVFSEERRRFLGMDYEDGAVAPAPVVGAEDTAVAEPAANLRTGESYAPHLGDGERDVALESEEGAGGFGHTEEHPVDRPTDEHAPSRGRGEPDPATEAPEPDVVVTPMPPTGTMADPGMTPTPVVVPAEEGEGRTRTEPDRVDADGDAAQADQGSTAHGAQEPAASGTPDRDVHEAEASPVGSPTEQQPAASPEAEEKQGGFFRKLFGRKR